MVIVKHNNPIPKVCLSACVEAFLLIDRDKFFEAKERPIA